MQNVLQITKTSLPNYLSNVATGACWRYRNQKERLLRLGNFKDENTKALTSLCGSAADLCLFSTDEKPGSSYNYVEKYILYKNDNKKNTQTFFFSDLLDAVTMAPDE